MAKGLLVAGRHVEVPDQLKDGEHQFLQLDDKGNLKVTLSGSLPAFAQTPDVQITGNLPGFAEPPAVLLAGETLEELLTQDDADNGTLTFSEPIEWVEIYNTDQTNDGTFNVNGIDILVPKGEVFKSRVAGTPSNIVTVSGATTYIVGRYS